MKKAIVGIVAIAGLASIAAATTTVKYEVRVQGSSTWSSNVDVAPGATVEFRCLLNYTGAARRGLQGFNSQPTISNWASATDSLSPFIASNAQSVAPTSRNGAVIDLNTGYGRRYFPQIAGIASENALRGHTNTVSGVNYLRIAQFGTTNWIGTGPTTGTAAANNTNGAGGVPISQVNQNSVVVGTPDEIDWPVPVSNGSGNGLPYVDNGVGASPRYTPYPVNPAWGEPVDDGAGGFIDPNPNPDANSQVAFVTTTANLEVYRFAVTVGGSTARTLTVSTSVGSFLASGGNRVVQWYTGGGTSTSADIVLQTAITGATINVIPIPTPGAIALLGLGGLVAGRRRR